MDLKDIVEMTYNQITQREINGNYLHFAKGDLEYLKKVILGNLELINSKKEEKVFTYLITEKIRINKLVLGEKQIQKYGKVIMNDYNIFLDLFNWLELGDFEKEKKKEFKPTRFQVILFMDYTGEDKTDIGKTLEKYGVKWNISLQGLKTARSKFNNTALDEVWISEDDLKQVIKMLDLEKKIKVKEEVQKELKLFKQISKTEKKGIEKITLKQLKKARH